MAHIHDITDDNPRFLINPRTRGVTPQQPGLKLIQGDHNSERLTFEVPRFVEGHDMSECPKIEVHFVNISVDKKSLSAEVYPVDDVQVSPDSDDVIIFSWLISGNATRYAGILSFLIKFTCLTGETIDYVWHTDIYSDITVGEGMDNGEAVIAEYSDVLEAWKNEIFADFDDALARIEAAKNNMLEEIELAAEIVQSTGDSETKVMSQKAVTAELDAINEIVKTDDEFLYDKNQNTENVYWMIDTSVDMCFEHSYTGWLHTQFFPINSNSTYKYSGLTTLGGTPMAAFFGDDTSRSLKGGYFKAQTGENVIENIPADAKYISFSVNSADVDTFSFIKVGGNLREEVEALQNDFTKLQNDFTKLQNDVIYGNLKELPSASESKLLIVPSTDGGLAYSDGAFWRWAKDNGLAVSARAYQTMRVADGVIINRYKSDIKYPIYSITKLLSSVAACECIEDVGNELTYNTTTELTADDITSWDTSAKFVRAGDTATFEALLNSSLVQSDNNAAEGLRRPIGRVLNPNAANNGEAINSFYAKMAEVAERAGMTNTSGFTAANSGVYSTAADLCKLLAYIHKNCAKVKEIWAKPTYTMSVTGANARTWVITSTTTEAARELLPEFDGGKTGSSGEKGAYAFCWKDASGVEYATALCEMTLATGDRFQDARHIIDEVYVLTDN